MVTKPEDLSGLIWKVKGRLGLARLADTEQGDVFFLVADPTKVYLRKDPGRWVDDHLFIEVRDDAWRPMKTVGDGTEGQVVMVIHNIEKPLRANTPGV